MKIALVVYTWSETRGGVERYVFDLARGLMKRGNEVHVWSRRREGETPGVVYHEVPGTSVGHLKYTAFAKDVEQRVNPGDYDCVHGFGRAFTQDLLRIGGGCHEEYLRQTRGREPGALWFLFHPKDRALIRLEKEMFAKRCWRRLVCISNRVAEEVHRIHGVPLADCQVIHNGTDVEKFHPRNRVAGDATTRLLFAGSGFERKGLEQTLAALARVDGPWRLRVVGRGDTGAYSRQAGTLGIADRVGFAGPQTDMPAEYGRADALVFPSLYDAFGTVALEAMATGIPVVISRQAGASEIVDHGRDGLIVENPRDPASLAAALQPLVADAARRRSMGETARVKAEGNSIEANIEKVVAVYRDIARGKGRTPA